MGVLPVLRRDRFERALEVFEESGLRLVDDDGAGRVRRRYERESLDDPRVADDRTHAVGDVDHVAGACGCDRDICRRRLNFSGGEGGDQPHLEFLLHSAFLRRWLGTQTVCPLSIRGQCPNGRIPVALGDLSASQAAFRVYESFQRVQDVADLGVQLLEG